MYTKYFGFNEKPFTLTPNPRFIFLSKNHKEAFAHLLYGINNHYGFIEMAGEVGTGKTTVLRTLLGQLQDEHYRTALIFNPCLTGVELLRTINQEFGINAESTYVNELLTEMNRFLVAENAAGRTVVLVIDEAQNLQPDVLEQLRLISNLETEHEKLIQIILAGQPELENLLQRPELRQLNQRIAVRYRLRSMSMGETHSYIRHRMDVAGESGGVFFTRGAVRLIYLYTRGVPRMINILCDRSLLIGYGDECRKISSAIVTRAIREILNVSNAQRLPLFAAALIALILLITVSNFSVSLVAKAMKKKPSAAAPAAVSPKPSKAPLPAPPPVVAATPSPPLSKPAMSPIEREISSYDQQNTHMLMFNVLAECWGKNQITRMDTQLTVPEMFSRISAKRGMTVTRIQGTLDGIAKYNMPFVIETNVRGPLGPYHLAVMAVSGDRYFVVPALFGKEAVSKSEMATAFSGTAYLVWQNSARIPIILNEGDKRMEVKSLQKLLHDAGFYRAPIDGGFSRATIQALKDFQKERGISQDTIPGELTLALLYAANPDYPVPHLIRK